MHDAFLFTAGFATASVLFTIVGLVGFWVTRRKG